MSANGGRLRVRALVVVGGPCPSSVVHSLLSGGGGDSGGFVVGTCLSSVVDSFPSDGGGVSGDVVVGAFLSSAFGCLGGGVVDPVYSGFGGGVDDQLLSGGGGGLGGVVVGALPGVGVGRVGRGVVDPYHSGGGGGGGGVVGPYLRGGGGGVVNPFHSGGGGGVGDGVVLAMDGEGEEYGVNDFGPARRYEMILASSDIYRVLELPVGFGDYLFNDRGAPGVITILTSLDENSPRSDFDVRYRAYKHRAYVTKKTWSGFAADHGLEGGDELSFEEHGDTFLLTAFRDGVPLW